jgi:hypothetical protein
MTLLLVPTLVYDFSTTDLSEPSGFKVNASRSTRSSRAELESCS